MDEWVEGHVSEDSPRRRVKRPKSAFAKSVQFVFSILLGLLVFVGFPALATAIAPVSWITLERAAGQVNAQAKTCLLFLIPYRTQTIEAVDRISERYVAGEYNDDSSRHHRDRTKSENQGFMVIHSRDQVIEIPVTPVNLKPVCDDARDFLDKPDATQLKLFVVANWKFSVILGGLLSLLTVFYFVVLSFDLGLKLIHGLQWTVGVPEERRLLAAWVKKTTKDAGQT